MLANKLFNFQYIIINYSSLIGFYNYPPFAIYCEYENSEHLKKYNEVDCKLFRTKTLNNYVHANINQISWYLLFQ